MTLEVYDCELCSQQIEETLEHIFLLCPFATACWLSLGVIVPQPGDCLAFLEHAKVMLNVPFFMEIIITMLWSIWEVRNDAIFRNIAPSVTNCRRIFKKEFAWIIIGAKTSYHPFIDQWLEAFV